MYDIIINGIVFETVSCLEVAMSHTASYRSRGMNAVYHPHLGSFEDLTCLMPSA